MKYIKILDNSTRYCPFSLNTPFHTNTNVLLSLLQQDKKKHAKCDVKETKQKFMMRILTLPGAPMYFFLVKKSNIKNTKGRIVNIK